MSRIPSRLVITLTLLLATLWWSSGPVHPAHAATDVVADCGNDVNLRSAISNAAAGDTITFACSGTIALSFPASTILLSKNLTIDGSGQTVTIDGGGNCQLGMFEVSNNANVALRGLMMANCGTASTSIAGGGSLAAVTVDPGSTLTVSNSTFSHNVSGTVNAGAIYNFGTLTVTNSTFGGNIGANGGAIDNQGTLTVTNSTFGGNDAQEDGGGAILSQVGPVTVTNSIFGGNSAEMNGGAIDNVSGRLTITNTIFSGNQVTAGGGGGLANAGTATIRNSIFSGNTASGFTPCGAQDCPMGAGILTGQANPGSGLPAVSFVGATTLVTTELVNNVPASSGNQTQECFGNTPTNTGTRADDTTCGVGATSGLTPISLNLGQLADNGGPTQTIAVG